MNKLIFSHRSNFFQILVASILSMIIYLFLVFNDGLIGYIAILMMFFAYIVVFSLSTILFMNSIKEGAVFSIVISVISSCWVIYGLGSEFFSNGINLK